MLGFLLLQRLEAFMEKCSGLLQLLDAFFGFLLKRIGVGLSSIDL